MARHASGRHDGLGRGRANAARRGKCGQKIVAHRKHSDNTNNKDGTTGTNGENDSNKYTDEKTVEHKTDEGDKQA